MADSMYLGSDRKQLVNHLQIRLEDSRVQRKTLRERENAKAAVGKNAEGEGASETEKKNKKKCWGDLKV